LFVVKKDVCCFCLQWLVQTGARCKNADGQLKQGWGERASLRERSRVLNADKIMQNGRILLIFSTFSSFYLRMCEIICNFAPAFRRLCADGARKLHNIKYLKQKTKQK
ncbi:MAG: hypothetical protein SPD82_04045, partial [Prevotella sp.]|nr:hypothetical protein [Prevotella sp.]MDY4538492.1 hypothetical protein [Prevotella sp.]